MSGALIYIAVAVITATLINGYMKTRYFDAADEMFFSIMGGIFWPLALTGLFIHLGGETVKQYMEENYNG